MCVRRKKASLSLWTGRRHAVHAQKMNRQWADRKRQKHWDKLRKPAAMLQRFSRCRRAAEGHVARTGSFPIFRTKPVSGETHMPLDSEILEGGGNVKLKAWRAFGRGSNVIRFARKASRLEHALFSGHNITIVTQGNESLAKMVMTAMSSDDRMRTHTPEGTCMWLEGGAGGARRWCGKEDVLPNLSSVIKNSQGEFSAEPQVVAEHHATGWKRD